MLNQNEDTTILKIKGDSSFQSDGERVDYIKKLSSAVLIVFSKHNSVKLKAVGASSIKNAMMAIANARGEGTKKGLNLRVEPSYGEADFDGNVKTAMVFKVVDCKT